MDDPPAAMTIEPPSLDQVIDRYGAGIRQLCRHFLGDSPDVDDAEQEVWAAVQRGLPSFRGDAQVATWAHAVARGALIDFVRKRGRRARHETPVEPQTLSVTQLARLDDEPLQRLTQQERVAKVRAALDRLPAIYREPLVLRTFDKLRYAEIAEALGIPEGTVKSRMATASAMLAKSLFDQKEDAR